MRFRGELLPNIHVRIPLAEVNREARHIALLWAAKQGYTTFFCREKQCNILGRRFDPSYDALFFSALAILDYVNQKAKLVRTDIAKDQLFRVLIPELTRLAIPPYPVPFGHFFRDFPNVEEVLIVCGHYPRSWPTGMDVVRRLETKHITTKPISPSHGKAGKDMSAGKSSNDDVCDSSLSSEAIVRAKRLVRELVKIGGKRLNTSVVVAVTK